MIAALLLMAQIVPAGPQASPAPNSEAEIRAPEPAAPVAAPGQLTLHLICRGTGDRAVDHVGFAGIFGRHRSASALAVTSEQEQFGEQMDIEVAGGAARTRVPRRFLPPFHGGQGGWFGVKDLTVTDEAITGKVLINYAMHPNIRIDRRVGSVALDGKVGSFAGQCEAIDPSKHAF